MYRFLYRTPRTVAPSTAGVDIVTLDNHDGLSIPKSFGQGLPIWNTLISIGIWGSHSTKVSLLIMVFSWFFVHPITSKDMPYWNICMLTISWHCQIGHASTPFALFQGWFGGKTYIHLHLPFFLILGSNFFFLLTHSLYMYTYLHLEAWAFCKHVSYDNMPPPTLSLWH